MSRAESKRELYNELVRTYAPNLYRFAQRLCGDTESAEDLVQDTYCEAWRSIDSLREPESGRAWLFQILRRRFSHSIRQKQRSVPVVRDDGAIDSAASDTGPDVLALLSQRELMSQAISELDERFKEPFLLMFVDGLSCQEIATALDAPLGTVLSRIHRARVFLRRRLRELDADEKNQSEKQVKSVRRTNSNA